MKVDLINFSECNAHRLALPPQKKVNAEDVEMAVFRLPPRIGIVIALRYGLFDGHQRTLREVGKIMGVSGNRIRMLEQQGFEIIRKKRSLFADLDLSIEDPPSLNI